MKRKRKPRKRIGTSRALLACLLAAVLLPAAFLPIQAAPKKKPALDTYALISVSVFDDGGYALAGANVTLVPEVESGSSSDSSLDKTKAKSKPLEAVSGDRGEFVFRVPPGPKRYVVTADAKGYQSQRKTVAVEDQERVEVTLQLERQSK
ncbi:MAG: carboxypeptidase-like regulatory domain-containing protein [Bryobacteraceae bacterium]